MSGRFEGRKLIAVGGSSGMGKENAADVVAEGGSAVIVGRDKGRVDETVAELRNKGDATGITADLADRAQVEDLRQQLAADHSDATLLVNAAGFFIPKPFLEYDGDFYDSYLELTRAIFFVTQTVAKGMIDRGQGGSIVNIGSMWAHQAIGATPSSGYSVAKAGGARADQEPCPRTGAPQDPSQRGRPSGGEDPPVRRLHPQRPD
jgi:short-subunit dehydrogenase